MRESQHFVRFKPGGDIYLCFNVTAYTSNMELEFKIDELKRNHKPLWKYNNHLKTPIFPWRNIENKKISVNYSDLAKLLIERDLIVKVNDILADVINIQQGVK